MSDSSDEEPNYRSHIQIPHINLDDYRRSNQRKTPRSNLAKAGRKLTGHNKSVRFPDSYNPRDTIVSNNSATTVSDSGLEDMDDDDYHHQNVDASLPSFQFRADNENTGNRDDSDDSDDADSEESDHQRIPNFRSFQDRPQALDVESESDDDSEVHSGSSSHSKGPFQQHIGPETDLVDQPKRPSIQSATSKGSDERNGGGGGGIKNILRKMSLAEHAYTGGFAPPDVSASDGFLGRVMSMTSDHSGGLSGGGLAPGASKASREKPLDEEQAVGNDIEMKPMEFEDLSEEAKKLISQHLPKELIDQNRSHESSSGQTTDQPNTQDQSEPVTQQTSRNEFYAPNPDMFHGGDLNFQEDEFGLDEADGYVAPPKHVHAGVLSSLLRLYQNPQEAKSASSFGTEGTNATTLYDETNSELEHIHPTRHGHVDFKKLKSGIKKYPKAMSNKMHSKKGKKPNKDSEDDDSGSFDEKLEGEGSNLPSFQNAKPKVPKKFNPGSQMKKLKHHRRADKLRITVHIADILQRQRFIMRMCRALMLFGAPTHRLEEYMVMTSRVLEIDGQFMYFPGCMIVSFGDAATRTSEVHLVRCAQGVNLSKLADTHRIYKGVIHDLTGVEEAARKLEELLRSKNLYSPWMCVIFYGVGSAAVCPFAFSGGWTDLPIAFGVGCCVGYLQFIVSSISNLYSSVFEVTSSIVVAFIARAIGSIHGGKTFCFSAIAQGSLALILPGYIILCGSLELQSRNMVAGSVRMFYAIIYSLFLGFGITLGGALYGWVDKNSVSADKCSKKHQIDDKWRILFVPLFSLCLGLINQARFRQLPVMIFISSVGYIGNYFAGKHFSSVTEFTACIGAFIVGILGNLYSRIGKGMAVSAMLPAIFVQVPSGIASQSSLVSGIQAADQITRNNGTRNSDTNANSGSLGFGITMVEVSIGISVGLFAAALVVYPLGKRRTGLFTL